MTEWEEVKSKGDYWVPEKVGDELEGRLVERAEGQYGSTFTIEMTNNKRLKTPSHKMLQSRLDQVPINSVVRIVFEGTELPKVKGQNPMSVYKVFTAKQ